MNYLDLINKCLIELNYKQVESFSGLTKNEHKKLKNILNVVNSEICHSEKWAFLQRKVEKTLSANTGELENTIPGRIEKIIVDGQLFSFCPDYEKFFLNCQPHNTYSFYNDKILFPMFSSNRNVEILYYTQNCAKNSSGQEKLLMENSDDKTLIPDPYVEPILVYGGCMRLKGNPQHIRFNYWLSMYKNALANLRSGISQSVDDVPGVNIKRR